MTFFDTALGYGDGHSERLIARALGDVRNKKESVKARAFGVSSNDWDPYGPVGAMEAGLLDTVQVIYNIFEQRPAERLPPAAQAHDVGIIVRVPFEEGLLTGELTPDCRFAPGDWRAEWLTPERLASGAG